MLYREITEVCSEIHTKHINTLFGQNVEERRYQIRINAEERSHVYRNSDPCSFQSDNWM